MGWANPWVIGLIVVGLMLLLAFPFVESRVEDPMFCMDLLRFRKFAYGNAAGFLFAIARGGVMIILTILLQKIWLSRHGFSYASTPFCAGVYMLPLTTGFVFIVSISGLFSGKYGVRWIKTLKMILVAISFVILALLAYDFECLSFAIALLFTGIGNGMFASPNFAAIINSLPARDRVRSLRV